MNISIPILLYTLFIVWGHSSESFLCSKIGKVTPIRKNGLMIKFRLWGDDVLSFSGPGFLCVPGTRLMRTRVAQWLENRGFLNIATIAVACVVLGIALVMKKPRQPRLSIFDE